MLYRSLPNFDYQEPATVAEAGEMITAAKGGGAILAGGLGLLVEMKRRWKMPKRVVSLQRIPSLKFVAAEGDGQVLIGAMTTIREAESDSLVRSYGALSDALGVIHSLQVKQSGTLVGNVCVGTPASDILAALIVHGAYLRVARGDQVVRIDLDCLCEDAKKTCLQPTDVVTEIVLPAQQEGSYSSYLNLSRTKGDIAKVGVGVSLTLADDGLCTHAVISLGAVAPTVIRPGEAERLLRGSRVDPATVAAVADAAYTDPQVRPVDDIRSTAQYRREMVRVLVRRSLEATLRKAALN